MLFDVFNKLRLNVRLSWNGDWFAHEGFIEIHFIHLQFELFGNLEDKITFSLKKKLERFKNYSQ